MLGVKPVSSGTHTVVVVPIWFVSLRVSVFGGTVVMMTVVSHIPVFASQATIHTVSVPIVTPVVLTLTHEPSMVTVVVVWLGVPAQFRIVAVVMVMPCSTLIQVSTVQPMHIVSRMVSCFGVLLKIITVVSQLLAASQTTTQIVSKL